MCHQKIILNETSEKKEEYNFSVGSLEIIENFDLTYSGKDQIAYKDTAAISIV